MSEAVIPRILSMYGLDFRRTLPMQKGYRNQSYAVELTDGRMANLILYKTEPDILTKITHANAVSNFLANKGMSVRQTLDSRIVCLSTGKIKKYGALYNYLPGQTIPWEAYTMHHLKLLGKTMSNMHTLLIDFSGTLPDVTQECLALNNRMLRYFADPNVVKALQTKLGVNMKLSDFSRILLACSKLQFQQVLHMDFVRGNILFKHNKSQLTISGVIDFEKASYGHPVFDIARTLAFLLVDCKFKTEPKIRKYFLTSGYNKRGQAQYPPLIIDRQDVLEELIIFFLVHDFYKFLQHNPYEYLPLNEHFVFTKDLLRQRDIISP